MSETNLCDDCVAVMERIEQTSDSARQYNSAIRVFSRWYDDCLLTADNVDIDAYLRHLTDDREYAYDTVTTHRSGLVRLFKAGQFLADADRLAVDLPAENPAQKVDTKAVTDGSGTKKERELDRRKDRHALPKSDVEALIENVPTPTVRNELLCRLSYQCMLRRGEVVSLKQSDIDGNDLTVRAEVSKTGESRTVRFNGKVKRLFDMWAVDREAKFGETEYLFPSDHRDGHITPERLNTVVKMAAKDAEIQDTLYTTAHGHERQKVTAHTLRHSGAVRRWQNDVDLRTLQKALGHSKITTTEDYLDVSDDSVGEKMLSGWTDDD
ncbi:tyrosine-type recombinase/integrase [Haloarcula rubripromontorii]|uniref:tyrosine-type recombinase/integrase n=1 Tax=Haloarcula rubripromontorii TaxID=1705562 RepID=UPI00345B85A4